MGFFQGPCPFARAARPVRRVAQAISDRGGRRQRRRVAHVPVRHRSGARIGTVVGPGGMRFGSLLGVGTVLGCAVPAVALYRIDTFAGRGYGDGSPAIAAAVVSPADAVTDAAGNVY